jgi:hypothetical protein
VPIYDGKCKIGGFSPDWLGQKARPYLHNDKAKRAGGVVQVIECLPSICEALSSNPKINKLTN